MARSRALHAPERAMIAVADAGYRLATDDETWLQGVLEAARPLLDHGSFVHGWIVDLTIPAFRTGTAIQMPEGADFVLHVRDQHPDPRAPDMEVARIPASLSTASQLYRLEGAALANRAFFPPGFDVSDCVALTASDPAGIACTLMGALSSPGRYSARDQAKWGRVAAHLGAALRLRERLRATPIDASLDAADALLDPRNGQIAHASTDASAHLPAVRAAAEVLSARHTTTDPERLVAAWRALIAGRWSLVDSFDTDGKRFFVLRRNEPAAPGPSLLTPTQRAIAAYVAMGHSNKAIAYHLGVGESSATRAVHAICKALHVRSRTELAQLAGALEAHPEHEP